MIYFNIVFTILLTAAITYILHAIIELLQAKTHCHRIHNVIQNPHGALFMFPNHTHHRREHNHFHCHH